MPAYNQGAGIANTADLGSVALKPQIRKMINDNRKTWPTIYTTYMRKETSKEYYEEYLELGGFGDVPRIEEGGYVTLAKPPTGYKVRVQPERRQLGFGITYEDRKYNRIRKVEHYTKRLNTAFKKTEERVAALILNDGFNGDFNVGSDNEPLFSTEHVLVNGEIAANKPTVDVDLGMETLELAMIAFMEMKDNDGTPIQLMPKFLMTHPQNYFVARRLLMANNYFPGGTPSYDSGGDIISQPASGVQNFIKDMGLIPVVNPYFEDPDAWFLFAGKDEQEVMMVENEAVGDRDWTDPQTQVYIYSMTQSYVPAFLTWFGTYGSEGAGG